jgi:RNA polymerase sigma factor (sigma-70 family)
MADPPRSPPAGRRARTALVKRAEAYLRPLLNYARGEIRVHEALGLLPPGTVAAHDLVDAALLEAFTHAGDPPPRRLYPWLRRLVRRALAREVAAWGQRRTRSLDQPLGGGWPDEEGTRPPRRLSDVLPDPSAPIPAQVAESAEFQRLLATLLWHLPRGWREPFLLHVRDGFSEREVARIEGLPVAEVRRRIALARQFLRAHLAEEYEDGAVPPPTEALFEVLERVEPTPQQVARLRGRPAADV